MTTIERIKKTCWADVTKAQKELAELEEKHRSLGQVDLLSQEGNKVREQIQLTKGRIQGMVWVLNHL